MSIAYFRFYEELNDFLPAEKRKKLLPYTFRGNPSVKDAIEAMRVPHVEVDLILVNDLSVDFSYKLKDADSVAVYPVFESFDITSVSHLREKPLRNLKFITDVHLGKLTKYLRLCGFDTFFNINLNDKEIIEIAASEKRIILTRDIGLLKNKNVKHGHWIRSQYPFEQLKDLFTRLQLKNQVSLFSRCSVCNGLLSNVEKEEIMSRLLPKTRQYYDEFKKCDVCDRIYWKGSHYLSMIKHIESLMVET
ncbi:MAG TPA: Mut7-C RNAse domain-containing protein [Bacteroidales bacterium]|nr:Mut7-C RNAse domain-containing protein [Bacteroidales bacterium]HPT21128.1 Mut7-C RNAse domain-containing protein [Bacteroidales bacterium]